MGLTPLISRVKILEGVENIIQFLIDNNVLVILAVASAMAALLLVWSVRTFVKSAGEETSGSSGADLSQIEQMLKDVLSKSQLVTGAPAPAAGGEEGAQPDPMLKLEIEKLQTELVQKQSEIEQAKKSSAGLDPEEKKNLEARIQELEAKLSEYEIIAEDIADLSKFKEENVQLKKQLAAAQTAPATETPQAASATEPATVATPEPEKEPDPPAAEPNKEPEVTSEAVVSEAAAETAEGAEAPAAIDDDLMKEFAQAVAEQKAAPEAEPTKADPTAIDDSVMDEFTKAVEEQKAKTANKEEPVVATPKEESAAVPAEESKPAEPVAVEAAPESTSDEAAAPKTTPDEEPAIGGPSVDLEAMMTEAVTLKEPEGEVENIENALEQEINPDKLAAEASDLEKIKPEDVELMNNFEDFVKGR